MPHAAQRILLGIAAAMVGIDIVWALAGHFDVVAGPYGFAAMLAGILLGAWYFYEYVRKEPAIAAMLFGMAFLAVFSGSCGLFNYFALTISGPRIDTLLAHLDRAMGYDWPAVMAFVAQHPLLDRTLFILYQSVLPQIILLVALLAWAGRIERIYGFCLSIAIGALMTVAFWTLFPSFGAFSVYTLPVAVSRKLTVVLDRGYAQSLVALLQHGPGHIVPASIKGLVGFPSFHAVQALVITWYARDLKKLFYYAAAINFGVLMATPIQGGHDFVDLAGGVVVCVAAVALSDAIIRRAAAPAQRPLPVPSSEPQLTLPRAGW